MRPAWSAHGGGGGVEGGDGGGDGEGGGGLGGGGGKGGGGGGDHALHQHTRLKLLPGDEVHAEAVHVVLHELYWHFLPFVFIVGRGRPVFKVQELNVEADDGAMLLMMAALVECDDMNELTCEANSEATQSLPMEEQALSQLVDGAAMYQPDIGGLSSRN